MRGAEGVVDVHVAERGQALAELLDGALVGLDLVTVGVLAAALLLGVEAQVLEEHDAAVGGAVDGLLRGLADAVVGEGDLLAVQELLELSRDGLEGVFGVGLAVGAAQVGHQDDSLGAILDGVLDGGEGADDALVVGDLGVGLLVEGHVEVDADEDPLVLKVDIGDGELAGERHLCCALLCVPCTLR